MFIAMLQLQASISLQLKKHSFLLIFLISAFPTVIRLAISVINDPPSRAGPENQYIDPFARLLACKEVTTPGLSEFRESRLQGFLERAQVSPSYRVMINP